MRRPSPRRWRLQARLRLSDPQLRRLVTKLPQLLGLDYDAEVAPKLDALAARGVLFRNAWAYPVCSPTRAAVSTTMAAAPNA